MEFFRLLRRESDRATMNLLAMAAFSGILSTLLVALIIGSASNVTPGRLSILDLAKFAFCLAFYVYGRRYVLTETSALAEQIVMKMRLRILEKVRRSNLLRFEEVGTARIYSVLNESATTLSSSASSIAGAFSSAVMLIFATFYVAYLSLVAFIMLFCVSAVGIFLFSKTRKNLEALLKRSTETETEFFGLIQHLLHGIKEVKINQARSDDLYHNYIVKTSEEVRNLRMKADDQFAWMSIIGQNFLYVLLGFLIFVLPAFNASDAQRVVQLATAIIFIMGPLGEVVGSMPLVVRSNSALAAINALESTLDRGGSERIEVDESFEDRLRPFHEISLRGVSFAYEHGLPNGAFRLGPVDLTVRANEVLFIVGGNGTGKSTLLKVITGLYAAERGDIFVDSQVIRPENLPTYRSLFSAIFTDFHLFDRLYGLKDVSPEAVEQLIREVRLQGVTRVEGGRFTRINLSTGQKKRLALIVTFLEQRPVLVFDEVAADQDPGFRKYFYEVLLRRLQGEGKTIVAVTHDDHYFHVADRVLRMEDGKFTEYAA